MLAKKYRLAKTKDIEAVAKRGQKIFSPYFLIKIFKNDLPHSRITVIVSKKVSNKATIRNRLKRIITEQLRLNFNQIKTGLDILVLISPKILVNGKIVDGEKIKQRLFSNLPKF